MKHTVSHDLDLPTAKKVTQKAFETYRERFVEYNPTLEWLSDKEAEVNFSAKGVSIEGTFVLRDKQIDIDLNVPFVLSMFKNKAIEIIDREMRAWITKAKSGQI